MSKILDKYAITGTPTYTYAYPFVMASTLLNKVQFLSHHPAFVLNDAGTNFRRFFPDEEITSNRDPGVQHSSANGASAIILTLRPEGNLSMRLLSDGGLFWLLG